MKLIVRNTLLCIFGAILSGCAMKSVYDISPDVVLGGLGGVSVTIKDNRPNDEKKKSYGSFIIGSSDYGVWTLGDESFEPSPIDALHQRVMQSAAEKNIKPQNIQINVEHLVIQDNQQAYLLRDGSSSLGPLGIVIAQAMHGQDFEFDHDKTLPFVLAFFQAEVVIDGVVRSVTFSRANNYAGNTDTEGRDKATRKTAKEFFSGLGKLVVDG